MEANNSNGQGGSQGCNSVETEIKPSGNQGQDRGETGGWIGNSHLLSEPFLEALDLWTLQE